MSFLDLRFAAELLKQGFTREEILGMIAGKPEAADAPNKKEETPAAVSGETPAAPAAPASTGPPAAAAPEGSPAAPAASPPEGSPHSRTETKTEKKTFAQLLAENS